MPGITHPHLYAVRDNMTLSDKQGHRLVAIAAIDDVTTRSRPRWQWTHPQLAELMGVPQPFVSLVGNYLDYRRTQRRIGTEVGIRPYKSTCAQTFRYAEADHPLDILNLGTSGDRTEQMAKLLMEATARKVRVEPDAVHNIERMLGRFCGMSWEVVVNTVQRQQAARSNVTTLFPTTTAMGVKAA
jgi:predicted transcriptional regulator